MYLNVNLWKLTKLNSLAARQLILEGWVNNSSHESWGRQEKQEALLSRAERSATRHWKDQDAESTMIRCKSFKILNSIGFCVDSLCCSSTWKLVATTCGWISVYLYGAIYIAPYTEPHEGGKRCCPTDMNRCDVNFFYKCLQSCTWCVLINY